MGTGTNGTLNELIILNPSVLANKGYLAGFAVNI